MWLVLYWIPSKLERLIHQYHQINQRINSILTGSQLLFKQTAQKLRE